MKSRYLFVLLWAGCASWAQAEIYKSVDAEGHVTYSSTPSRGAKKLGLEPLAPPSRLSQPSHSTSSSRPRQTRERATPYDFPRVDSNTQKRRDDMRYKILTDELAAEEKLLAEARTNLKRSEASGDSSADSKLRGLKEEVTLHIKNISALQTELSHIK